MKSLSKIERKSAIFEPNSNQIDNKIELFLNNFERKFRENIPKFELKMTQFLTKMDHILNNGFGLRGHKIMTPQVGQHLK